MSITKQAQLKDMNYEVIHNVGNYILHGVKTVTTAGTQVILLTSGQETLYITIKALAANAGTIYVGDLDVSSSNGFALAASEEVTLAVDHSKVPIYIDSSDAGEGVSYIGWYVR